MQYHESLCSYTYIASGTSWVYTTRKPMESGIASERCTGWQGESTMKHDGHCGVQETRPSYYDEDLPKPINIVIDWRSLTFISISTMNLNRIICNIALNHAASERSLVLTTSVPISMKLLKLTWKSYPKYHLISPICQWKSERDFHKNFENLRCKFYK